MQTIKIYHAPRELFNKINNTFDQEKRADLVRENLLTYVQVLIAPFGGYNLDDFYRYTQNIDESWTKKFGFEANHRSTSIGDIMTVDGRVFMVAGCGFTELDGVTL